MGDWKNAIWGIIGSIVTAALGGLATWIIAKRDDVLRLIASISQPGDLEVMQRIGCACMIVTVKSTGKRVAKIGGAMIALEGVDFIPHFEEAFGAKFGGIPIDVGRPPAFVMDLVPLKEPNCSDGFILERDDVARFAMPIQVPGVPLFTTAPSQNVWIAVKFFDDTERIVLRGLRIQQMIGDLIEMWGEQKQTLNVTLNFSLRRTSAVPPGNPELVGTTNPNPVVVMPQQPAMKGKSRDFVSGPIQLQFPIYALAHLDGLSVVFAQSPDGLVLPIFSSKAIAVERQRECPVPLNIIEFASMEALVAYIKCPPAKQGYPIPEFNIILDSIDPDGEKIGLIDRKRFLEGDGDNPNAEPAA